MDCGIGQNIACGEITGESYLGLFLPVVEQGTTVYGYSWCQIFIYPTKNDSRMSEFLVLYYFLR